MSEPQYIRWDYNTGEATRFRREGECNGCGACCRTYIKFAFSPAETPDGMNGGTATTRQGVWHEVDNDGDRRFFRFDDIDPQHIHRCPMLMSNEQCAIHVAKKLICSGFPFGPEQVAPFSECSYSFVEVARWRFEGESP